MWRWFDVDLHSSIERSLGAATLRGPLPTLGCRVRERRQVGAERPERTLRAGVAQLVEYKLPKLGVASSNLVARSKDVRLFVCLGVWVEFLFMYMWFVATSF